VKQQTDEPVWITGVGTATPLGTTYQAFADRLMAGQSCVDTVQRFDVREHPSQIAAEVPVIPCPIQLADPATLAVFGEGKPVPFERLHRLEQLVLWCCTQALVDSGWWERRGEVRLGVVLGMGAEWLLLWESGVEAGGRSYSHPRNDHNSLLTRVQHALGLNGPLTCLSAACASGNYALAQARTWLDMGLADVCVAGACDMGVSPVSLAGFGNLRALSRRNGEPQRASRPFDRDRDGFVMGEGGALFVLEQASSARRRGARVYAEVAGCGASSDSYHMVIPSPDPKPAVNAMRQALRDAGINPTDIDYINAHATSTPVGDICETRILHEVLGSAAATTPISSTKSMTGHLLTAAAAVEALACVAAMQRNTLPPTINLDHPDPECNLCHIPNQAREQPVKVTVSNSFGFGGSNTCLVLRAV
jgi:3-oxoacyl-[acyl-carrier-protein] synthase II